MANKTQIFFAPYCRAFTTFCDTNKRDRECMICLNPKDGCVGGTDGPLGYNACQRAGNEADRRMLEDSLKLMLRSSAVQCFITFEAYLHELLGEAFDEIWTSESTYQMVRRMMTATADSQAQDSQNSHAQGSQAAGETKKGKKGGGAQLPVSLAALRDAELENFRQVTWHKIKVILGKLFSVDKQMRRLESMLTAKEQFQVNLQIPQKNVTAIDPFDRFRTARCLITDTQTINQLLNLFYGIRCVCAHGNAKATFGIGGCLANFDIGMIKITLMPSNQQFAENEVKSPQEVYDYFEGVFKAIKRAVDDSYPMPINYHLYLNANNFIRRFATNFFHLVGCLTYHLQDKTGKKGANFWGTKTAEWDKFVGHVFQDKPLPNPVQTDPMQNDEELNQNSA